MPVLEMPHTYELSFIQEEIWLSQKVHSTNRYNLPVLMHLPVNADPVFVDRILNALINKHDTYRSQFALKNGTPFRNVTEHGNYPFTVVDFSDLNKEHRDAEVEAFLREFVRRVFDVSAAPLFRGKIIKLSDAESKLIFVAHHLIADGTSLMLLMKELITCIREQRLPHHEPSRLESHALPEQLSDWKKNKATELYWKQQLRGVGLNLNLPVDFSCSTTHTNRRKTIKVDHSLFGSANDTANLVENIPLRMLTAFVILMHRVSGQSEIVINIPVSLRSGKRGKTAHGVLVNLLPLRISVERTDSFSEIQKRVRIVLYSMLRNAAYPVQELLAVTSGVTNHSLQAVSFNYFSFLTGEKESIDEEVFYSGAELDSSFALNCYVIPKADGLIVRMDYNSALFCESTVDALLKNYLTIAFEGVHHFRKGSGDIAPLPLPAKIHEPEQPFPGQSLVEMLHRLEEYGEKIAVFGRCQRISYKALNDTSNQWSRYIRRRSNGKAIGICTAHDVTLAVSILSALKAEVPYVPLDATLPKERLSILLRELSVDVVLVDETTAARVQTIDDRLTLIHIDNLETIAGESSAPLNQVRDSGRTAYIMFTSGSTGKPKAVPQTTGAILHFLSAYSTSIRITSDDRLTGLCPFTYDSFNLDFYGALLNGATYFPLSTADALSADFCTWLTENEITILHCVPAVFRRIALKDKVDRLRIVKMTGEAVRPGDYEHFKTLTSSCAKFVVSYGAAECTLACINLFGHEDTFHSLILPVGFPVARTTVELWDEGGAAVKTLEAGEIVIKSDFVCRGYLNDELLNARTFITDGKTRYYRTGDVGRRMHDGRIQWMGRNDALLKINGIRVQAEEIELEILRSGGISDACVVLTKADEGDSPALVCLFRAVENIDEKTLRQKLHRRLPLYMIPEMFQRVDAFCYNVNGKLDRQAMQALVRTTEPLPGYELVLPENTLEETVLGLWKKIVGSERFGVTDSFFVTGGNSIKAIRLVSAINDYFHTSLSIEDIFNNPTVRSLAQIIARRSRADEITIYAPGDNDQEFVPVSNAQQRIWILTKTIHLPHTYNIVTALKVDAMIDQQALVRAWERLISHHEILRTTFIEREGQVYQHIRKVNECNPSVVTDCVADDIEAILKEEGIRKFDLENGPLAFMTVVSHGNGTTLILTVHHLIADGSSLQNLLQQLFTVYQSFAAGHAPDNTPPRFQYRHYSLWLEELKQLNTIAPLEQFWRNEFLILPQPVTLQGTKIRPATKSFHGDLYETKLPVNTCEEIHMLKQNFGTTPFQVLFSTIGILLYQYSLQEDFVIGIPVEGREHFQLGNQLGMFVNLLPIRMNMAASNSFDAVLKRNQEKVVGALKHQGYPFDLLVEKLELPLDQSRGPLVDIIVNFQDIRALVVPGLEGVQVTKLNVNNMTSKFDLAFHFLYTPQDIELKIEYNTDLFERRYIQRLSDHFCTLVNSIVSNPGMEIGRMEYLTSTEKQTLLAVFNQTDTLYPDGKCIDYLLEEQARRTPDDVAIVHATGTTTYRALNERSNTIAFGLSKSNPDARRFALILNRDENAIACMMAVMKRGALYVPIDPNYPVERVTFILEDAEVDAIIFSDANEPFTRKLRNAGVGAPAFVPLETLLEASPDQSAFLPSRDARSIDDVAYIIYTSGSTGVPKGIEIMHRNVSVFLRWAANEFAFSEFDIVYAVTSFCFDLSVFEIFFPLVVGKKVRVLPSPLDIRTALVHDKRILLNTVPSVIEELVRSKEDLSNVTVLNMAGEPIPRNLKKQLDYKRIEVRNLYGPSEDTTYSTVYRFDDGKEWIPIGKPIANTRIYILNNNRQLVPVGFSGEICIAGAGVARGYVGNAELTHTRFVANPFEPGSKMYRTGDLGRWDHDGDIEFIGREDGQVKLRGYRIELSEIESRLITYPRIEKAVVAVRTTSANEKILTAYFSGKAVDAADSGSLLNTVDQWASVFDNAYQEERLLGDTDINIAGWNSSYTGKPIDDLDMEDWLNETVELILRYRASHVLEIGCGTGMILSKLAGKIVSYTGTDISDSVVRYVNDRLSKKSSTETFVRILKQPAHEIETQVGEQPDMVVLNSTIQYFPSLEYLTDVITKAAKRMGGKGTIVIGDVRSLPLQRSYYLSTELTRNQAITSVDELTNCINRLIFYEKELLVDPVFFLSLKEKLSEISHIEILPKQSHFVNELTKFRYQVVIHLGPSMVSAENRQIDFIDFDPEGGHWKSVAESSSRTIIVQNVPNPRLSDENVATRLMQRDIGNDFGEIKSLTFDRQRKIDLLSALGMPSLDAFVARIYWARHDDQGNFDIFLCKKDLAEREELSRIYFTAIHNALKKNSRVKNVAPPVYVVPQDTSQIMAHLKLHLPDFMIPSEFIEMRAFPLNANGKIDRKKLPVPDVRTRTRTLRSPTTELQRKVAAIWSDVLGVREISIDDNFFEIGGHSLKALQVLPRLEKTLRVKLSIRSIIKFPTIESLSTHLEYAPPEIESEIPRIESQPSYEVSHAQRRLWLTAHIDAASPVYNMGALYRIDPHTDTDKLRLAFCKVISRHEILRTNFCMREGIISQTVHPFDASRVDFEVINPEALSDEKDVLLRAEQILTQPFNLESQALVRLRMIHAAQQPVLVLAMHHIVSDAWSVGILMDELQYFYTEGSAASLPPLGIQYKDFASWHNRKVTSPEYISHRHYWKKEFLHLPAALEFPTDFARPPRKTFNGGCIDMMLDDDLARAVKHTALREGKSRFLLLTTAVSVVLYKYTGQRDVVVGVPVTARNKFELKNQIGFYINTIPLRITIDPGATLRKLIDTVSEKLLAAMEHEQFPFDVLVEELNIGRSLNRSPLFDVSINYLDAGFTNATSRIAALNGTRIPARFGSSKFDLSFNFSEHEDDSLHLSLEYSAELFKASTARRIAGHLLKAIESLTVQGAKNISDLELMSEAEMEKLNRFVQGPRLSIGMEVSIVQLFQSMTVSRPEATALVQGTISMTYKQLELEASKVAEGLRLAGFKNGDVVAIVLPSSIALVVSMLGVMMAGGIVLPLDASTPSSRLDHCLRDANARYVFHANDVVKDNDGGVVFHGVGYKAINSISYIPSNLRESSGASDADVVYLMYTSGSTGSPKGVKLSNRNLINHFRWFADFFQLKVTDVIPQKTSLNFVDSIVEIFLPICITGSSVYLRPDDQITKNFAALNTWLKDIRSTVLQLVPSMLDFLDVATIPSLRTLILSGESLNARQFANVKKLAIEVYNIYGCTECNASSTVHRITAEDTQLNVIGRPIGNTEIFILDELQRPVVLGAEGEICIGGFNVADGYLNEPLGSDKKFIAYTKGNGSVLYRTGDVASFRDDGNILLKGRKDRQFKVRGIRVNPVEIESVLLSHPAVSKTVVLPRDTTDGVTVIVAYVVVASGQSFDKAIAMDLLRSRLPDYLVPSAIVTLDSIPVNTSGKTDLQALPALVFEDHESHREPTDVVEKILLEIWLEVLKVPTISIDRHFFEAGGHSLNAFQVVNRVQKRFEVNLDLNIVFQYPTIASLARHLRTLALVPFTEIPVLPTTDFYEVSYAQRRLWLAHELEGNNVAYNMATAYWAEGPLDVHAVKNAFRKIIARHEVLRSNFVVVNGELKMVAHACDSDRSDIALSDLRDLADPNAVALRSAYQDAIHQFDLAGGALMRVRIYQTENEKFLLTLNLHHIIADGWSMAVLWRELLVAYKVQDNDRVFTSDAPQIQYKDYANWQNRVVEMTTHATYWMTKLSGKNHFVGLKYDKQLKGQERGGGVVRAVLSDDFYQALLQFAAGKKITPSVVVLAVFKILLHKISGQRELTVGATVANRDHLAIENLIGFFSNTILVRTTIPESEDVDEFLQVVNIEMQQAMKHQQYPLDLIAEKLGGERNGGDQALFNVAYSYLDVANYTVSGLVFHGVRISTIDAEMNKPAKFDWLLLAQDNKQTLTLSLEYDGNRFHRDTMERYLNVLQAFLKKLLK